MIPRSLHWISEGLTRHSPCRLRAVLGSEQIDTTQLGDTLANELSPSPYSHAHGIARIPIMSSLSLGIRIDEQHRHYLSDSAAVRFVIAVTRKHH